MEDLPRVLHTLCVEPCEKHSFGAEATETVLFMHGVQNLPDGDITPISVSNNLFQLLPAFF